MSATATLTMESTRKAALDRIFSRGTFSNVVSGPCRKVGALVLYRYQEEALKRMSEIEDLGAVVVQEDGHSYKKRRAAQTLLCNVGLLSEPPMFGNTVIALAHIALSDKIDPKTSQFVKATDATDPRVAGASEPRACGRNTFRTFVPEETDEPLVTTYIDLDIDVVITPPRNYKRWVLESARMGVKVFGLNGVRSIRELQKTNAVELAQKYDAIVVHASCVRPLDAAFLGVRINRLFIDGAGSVDLRDAILKSRYVWAIDDNPYNILNSHVRTQFGESGRDHYSRNSGFVTDMFMSALSWVSDPSMFVVRHTYERVLADVGVEVPTLCIYNSVELRAVQETDNAVTADSGADPELVSRRAVVDYDAIVSSMEVAISRCPSATSQLRLVEEKGTECPICLEDTPKDVILNCCQKLICKNCLLNLHQAMCPFDRKPLKTRPGSVTVIGGEKPANVTYLYQSEWMTMIGRKCKASWLTSIVIGNIGITRLLVVVSDRDYYSFSSNLTMSTYLKHHGYQVADVRKFDSRVRVPGLFEKVAHGFESSYTNNVITIDPSANLGGCSLVDFTDVVFYSEVTDNQYSRVMARVMNPANPHLKRQNKRLRIHMFLDERQKVPGSVRLAYDDDCSAEYMRDMGYDIASYHTRTLRNAF